MDDESIWAFGATIRAKPPVAQAEIIVSAVTGCGLRVIPDTTDYENHANIVDWPAEKAERILKAQLLAKAARLKLSPE
ncbi:MAG: hypothetical protein ACM3SS_19580 [Rhodospirillaceae bacterium]